MGNVLVITEHMKGEFQDISFEMLGQARKLADDRRLLCASPEYLAKWGTPKHPDDLCSHQLIAFKSQATINLIGPDGEQGKFNPRAPGNRLIIDDGLSYKIATMVRIPRHRDHPFRLNVTACSGRS